MLDFRCVCGFVLSKGLPPIEALSVEQGSLADPDNQGQMYRDRLKGTRYEGMSSAGFCTPCMILVDFPSMPDVAPFWESVRKTSDDYVYINRMAKLLAVESVYKNADLSLAREIIESDHVEHEMLRMEAQMTREQNLAKERMCSSRDSINRCCGQIHYLCRCSEGEDMTLSLVRHGRPADDMTCSCCGWGISSSEDCGCSVEACEYC